MLMPYAKRKHNQCAQTEKQQNATNWTEDVAAEIKAVSSDLDALLARYQQMCDSSRLQSRTTSTDVPKSLPKIKPNSVPHTLSPHLLRPRMPATVKQRIKTQQAGDLEETLLQQHQQELAACLKQDAKPEQKLQEKQSNQSVGEEYPAEHMGNKKGARDQRVGKTHYPRGQKEDSHTDYRQNCNEHSHQQHRDVDSNHADDVRDKASMSIFSREGGKLAPTYSSEEIKVAYPNYSFEQVEEDSSCRSGDQRDESSNCSQEVNFNYYSDLQKMRATLQECEHQHAARVRTPQRKSVSKLKDETLTEPTDSTSVLGGLLSDLLSRGYITSISEEQKRSLQTIYSQLQDETRPNQQTENNPKTCSLSVLANRSQATYHGQLYEPKTNSVQSIYSDTEDMHYQDLEDNKVLGDSKNYIVSMIDKALNRELETIKEEIHGEKRNMERKTNVSKPRQCGPRSNNDDVFVRMDVAEAIDLVNSESSCGINKDLCMEITQALTDTLITKADKDKQSEISGSAMSRDNYILVPAEEPKYLRRLRQLRWDHLKHIKREVQRLEDIERFLDRCNSGLSVCETVSSPT
ncbi:hypothetical protein ANN_15244 [Periplaneta americana]|uniref:Uncharacterized protein n=1 Tax=Periplaneta americana TaxID=6978 RepID=A0ABQ8SFU3_PERAM|nr:hypothetical protein ANN_15244 [Periplaneta americana]